MATVFRTLSRVFLICAIFCIFYGAYFVAEQTFSNQPYNAQSHKKVTVIVTQNESDEKVAETLVSKKLIYGKTRFVIRKYFSKYKDKSFISGTYEFTQSQEWMTLWVFYAEIMYQRRSYNDSGFKYHRIYPLIDERREERFKPY